MALFRWVISRAHYAKLSENVMNDLAASCGYESLLRIEAAGVGAAVAEAWKQYDAWPKANGKQLQYLEPRRQSAWGGPEGPPLFLCAFASRAPLSVRATGRGFAELPYLSARTAANRPGHSF